MIVTYHGRSVRYSKFNIRFRRIAERAGIDAQARDLRRTAMLRMAEGGFTAPQIASVSGHSARWPATSMRGIAPANIGAGARAVIWVMRPRRTRGASSYT